MQVRVGITTSDLKEPLHEALKISGNQISIYLLDASSKEATLSCKGTIALNSVNSQIEIRTDNKSYLAKKIRLTSPTPLSITNLRREGGGSYPHYQGVMEFTAKNNKIQAIIQMDLEVYLRGVLFSEIPASYQIEAIKAQAVAARTYALNPRIDHSKEGFNVCDSYLCCQYFAGLPNSLDNRHEKAIELTNSEILTFADAPILALFSSIAGGHTENYENCFSDPLTGAFPPPPLPYLKGVKEGVLPAAYPSEKGMRQLFNEKVVHTCDAWSNKFRWRLVFSGNQLEAHMHHVLENLLGDKATAPFITPPPSNQFGHIKKFSVNKRGVAGTAISLAVHTSTGPWEIKKELVIRSLFKNPEIKIARLNSARIFFDHKYDKLGLLSEVVISGFGWGHGVGLQQQGAQGLALKGKTYREILAHYFSNTQIEKAK